MIPVKTIKSLLLFRLSNISTEGLLSVVVFATQKGPKPDGLACPRIDEYKVHISEKEKDASFT
jgi:hypothetical protein